MAYEHGFIPAKRARVGAFAGSVVLGGVLLAGFFPACDEEDPAPAGASCAPTDPACPAISAECLALVDNTGKDEFTLRLSQLTIDQPAALAAPFMQGIVSTGVNIN